MESLKSMVGDDELEAIWFRYEDTGFEAKMRYMDRQDMIRGLRQSKETRFNKKTHRKEDDYSDQKYNRYLARHVIVDWKGLTPEILKQFYPFKRELLEKIPPEGLSFSVDSAEFLIQRSDMFRDWVDECMKDTEAFSQEDREEQEKNLGASSPGSET